MKAMIAMVLSWSLAWSAFGAIQVEDEQGTLTLESVPTRVVALEFSFVDALANLGVSPVGVADDGDSNRVIEPIRAKIGSWTSVGSRSQPSLEVIAQLKPDLIIADVERHLAVYEDLKRIAPTLILKSRGESYEDNLVAVLKVAKAFDKEALMQQRLAEHSAIMDDYAAKIDTQATMMFMVSSTKGVSMHGPKAYAGGVLARLGLASPIPEETENAYPRTTLERLLKANPDYLLVGEYGDETAIDQFKTSPMWGLMKAVANDRYRETDPRLWSLNRGMIAAEIMAEEVVQLINGQ